MKKIGMIGLILLFITAPFVLVACDRDDFTPKLPVPLSEEMETRIKQDYYDKFLAHKAPHIEVDSIMFLCYYGEYSGKFVLITQFDLWVESVVGMPYSIAGIEFPGRNCDIWVWSEGDFYAFSGQNREALEELFTKKDIRNIAYLINNGLGEYERWG